MRVEVEVSGAKEISRKLVRLAGKANKMQPAFREIASDFYDVEAKQFDSQGAYGGKRWKPLTDSRRKYKRARGLDPRILHATKRLRNSLAGPGVGNVKSLESDSMFVGTSVAYAKYHKQDRPPVALGRDTRIRWVKILQRHLLSEMS